MLNEVAGLAIGEGADVLDVGLEDRLRQSGRNEALAAGVPLPSCSEVDLPEEQTARPRP